MNETKHGLDAGEDGDRTDLPIEEAYAAVGIVVQDTLAERFGLVTMLCSPQKASEFVVQTFAKIAVPLMATERAQRQRQEWTIKRLTPFVGELWHALARERGGMPTKFVDSSASRVLLPAVLITKKTISADWGSVWADTQSLAARATLAVPFVKSSETISDHFVVGAVAEDDFFMGAFSESVTRCMGRIANDRCARPIDTMHSLSAKKLK